MTALKNIAVLFLSLMVCYTSSGMNLFVHVCAGKISNISFSEAGVGCGMENKFCDFSKVNGFIAFNSTNDCCKDHAVKANLKIQNSDKTDNLNLFLPIQKAGVIILKPIHNIFSYELNKFVDISPHFISINSALEKGIYLFLQNFRN